MEGEVEEEDSLQTDSSKNDEQRLKNEIDLEELLLFQRFSRNELVIRFLSLVCVSFLLGLFLLQMDILWRTRQPFLMDLLLEDENQFHFLYPDFYRHAHNEETWCWDPNTLLLKVNTSLFMH